MPVVEDVLSHWVDLYSTSLDEVEYDDHLFYFGLKNTRDILVTTSLSALTLGVDLDNRQVGSIGTRVYNYWYFNKKGVLQYKLLPPSYEWNSEYISRCVSVRVRTAVFFASGTSLSNVYVFHRPGLLEKARGVYSTKAVIAFVRREKKKKKAIHRTTVSGPSHVLKAEWAAIKKNIRAESAALGEVSASRIALTVKNGRFRRAKRGDALPALGLRVPNLK